MNNKTKKIINIFLKKRTKKRKKQTRRKKKKKTMIHKLDKTIYKKSDFNIKPYPVIPILHYRALKMADNMAVVSSINNKNPIKKQLMKEYQLRLKILIKKNPRFKKKYIKNKNIDKLSPTKLEETYFLLLNLEKK